MSRDADEADSPVGSGSGATSSIAGWVPPVGGPGADPTAVAVALLLFGTAALVAGVVAPGYRTPLAVVGVTALFGAWLVYVLSPDRVIDATVANDVYAQLARTERHLAGELDQTTVQVYVPTGDAAVLYVPADPRPPISLPATLSAPQVPPRSDHLVLPPTGAPLFRTFEASLLDSLATEPHRLVEQVTEGLADTLELDRTPETTLDAADRELVVAFEDPVFEAGFDSPGTSFVGVALAVGLDTPVLVSLADDGGRVVYEWGVGRPGAERPG